MEESLEKNIVFVYPLNERLIELKNEMAADEQVTVYEVDMPQEFSQIIGVLDTAVIYITDERKLVQILSGARRFINKSKHLMMLVNNIVIAPHKLDKIFNAGLSDVLKTNLTTRVLKSKFEHFYKKLELEEQRKKKKKEKEDEQVHVKSMMALDDEDDQKKQNKKKFSNTKENDESVDQDLNIVDFDDDEIDNVSNKKERKTFKEYEEDSKNSKKKTEVNIYDSDDQSSRHKTLNTYEDKNNQSNKGAAQLREYESDQQNNKGNKKLKVYEDEKKDSNSNSLKENELGYDPIQRDVSSNTHQHRKQDSIKDLDLNSSEHFKKNANQSLELNHKDREEKSKNQPNFKQREPLNKQNFYKHQEEKKRGFDFKGYLERKDQEKKKKQSLMRKRMRGEDSFDDYKDEDFKYYKEKKDLLRPDLKKKGIDKDLLGVSSLEEQYFLNRKFWQNRDFSDHDISNEVEKRLDQSLMSLDDMIYLHNQEFLSFFNTRDDLEFCGLFNTLYLTKDRSPHLLLKFVQSFLKKNFDAYALVYSYKAQRLLFENRVDEKIQDYFELKKDGENFQLQEDFEQSLKVIELPDIHRGTHPFKDEYEFLYFLPLVVSKNCVGFIAIFSPVETYYLELMASLLKGVSIHEALTS